MINRMLLSCWSLVCSSSFAQNPDSSKTFNREKELTGVTIQVSQKQIEVLADKTVLHVQPGSIAASGTLFDLLQQAPGVAVSGDDRISMAGKAGVTIMVDGKQLVLDGKDLAAFLKNTPATQVDRLEIISNPSARYPAQGNAGIINIRLRKPVTKGFNGNITSAYTQGVHGNINGSALANLRRRQWNFYASTQARSSAQNTDGYLRRSIPYGSNEKIFNNTTTDRDRSSSIGFNTGADYYFSPQRSLGIQFQGNEYRSRLFTPGVTAITDPAAPASSITTANDSRQRTSRYQANINYYFEDSTGRSWNIDGDYTHYYNRNTGDVQTGFYNNNGLLTDAAANRQWVYTTITICGLKADHSRQYKKAGIKIETGIKWTETSTRNQLEAWSGIANPVADTGRTNTFRYTESNYAAYVTLTKSWKKWETQIGLRAEESILKGVNTDLKYNRVNYPDSNYLNLFPSFFALYTPNEKHRFSFSLTRRINRPGYQDLNPFEYIFDIYSREKGNPYLLPEFSRQAELTWSFKNALTITTGYSHTRNNFQNSTILRGDIAEATTINTGREHRLYARISLNAAPAKWWNSYTSITPFYKSFRGELPAGLLDIHTGGMNWYTSQSFTIRKNWKLQLSSWGNVATRDGMSRNASLGSLDIQVSRALFKKKAAIRITCTDILNTQRWQQDVQLGNVQYTYYRKWESRTIQLQLNWKFGKTSYRARERETGISGENDRIKK